MHELCTVKVKQSSSIFLWHSYGVYEMTLPQVSLASKAVS